MWPSDGHHIDLVVVQPLLLLGFELRRREAVRYGDEEPGILTV